nr:non-ribosomal peptide synthetase [Pseudoalteromonas sp. MMG013]
MLSEHEVSQLTSTLNNNRTPYPDKLLHELFEVQVAKTPDNIALVFDDATMTYNTLNEKANQLAQHLCEQGITTETLVGICVERSFDMIIGILAVLKAGGAYVPLDPHYPRARLQHIFADTQIKHLLSNTSVIEQVSLPDALNVMLLDKLQFDNYPTGNLIASTEHHSHSLAYIIYTSGSTGVPKGVMVEHHGVLNTILSQIDTFSISPQSKVLQFASMCFDASVSEIFMAILSGAQLHLCHAKAVSDTAQLEAMIQQQSITHITLPPTLLNSMALDNCAIQTLIVAGDKACAALIDKFSERFTLINAYGPTEASICVTAGKLSPNAHINIGQPISNVNVYILSPLEQLVPKGSVGELCVGGAGVARGYFNRQVQTAERFIKNPFSDNPDSKLYKTGDLVRYLEEGNIEFIGRNDTQVKIRGYRIELGEVESVLNQCNGVKNSVVLVKGTEEQNSLVGYVAVEGDIAGNESILINNLRAELHTMLPNYMVPSIFMLLDQLPLTTNGKIDKKALPDPDASLGQQNYVAPQSETEKSLLQIWSKLLKIESSKLSVTANFYEVGGHSLLTIKLLAAIRELFDLEVTVNQLYEFETISKLAGLIDDLLLRKMLSALKESAEVKSEGTL